MVKVKLLNRYHNKRSQHEGLNQPINGRTEGRVACNRPFFSGCSHWFEFILVGAVLPLLVELGAWVGGYWWLL